MIRVLRARSLALPGLMVLAGCYTYQPVDLPSPAPGLPMAFDLTDRGRAELGGQIGPEVGRIEGRVVEQSSGGVVLSVLSLSTLRGGHSTWSGERVTIKSDFVSRSYIKKFSPGRTVALGGAFLGGIAAFFITREIAVGGGGGNEDPPPCCNESRVIRP